MGDPRSGDFSEEDDGLDNFPFYINKSGLPIEKKTWDRMWRFASKLYPEARKEIESIHNSSDTMPHIPPPILPTLNPHSSVAHRLRLLQNFINALQYNHTGTQFFEIKKNRPIAGLVDTARDMVKEALPIKCLEAVILAIYLTNTVINVERFPLGFKSIFDGNRYYHIVLGLYFNGRFGAMGISRRKDLMDKPVIFKSLNDLILDYDTAYANYGHSLKKVRLGGAVSHDSCSHARIAWTVATLNMNKLTSSDSQRKLDQFTKSLRAQLTYPILSATTTIQEKPPRHPCLPPRREHTAVTGKSFPGRKIFLKPETREAKSASLALSKKKSQNESRKYQVKV